MPSGCCPESNILYRVRVALCGDNTNFDWLRQFYCPRNLEQIVCLKLFLAKSGGAYIVEVFHLTILHVYIISVSAGVGLALRHHQIGWCQTDKKMYTPIPNVQNVSAYGLAPLCSVTIIKRIGQ